MPNPSPFWRDNGVVCVVLHGAAHVEWCMLWEIPVWRAREVMREVLRVPGAFTARVYGLRRSRNKKDHTTFDFLAANWRIHGYCLIWHIHGCGENPLSLRRVIRPC